MTRDVADSIASPIHHISRFQANGQTKQVKIRGKFPSANQQNPSILYFTQQKTNKFKDMMTSRKDLHRLLLPLDRPSCLLFACQCHPDLETCMYSTPIPEEKTPGAPHILRELQLQEYQDTDQSRCPTICVRIDFLVMKDLSQNAMQCMLCCHGTILWRGEGRGGWTSKTLTSCLSG
jgi:hypothetical protein